MGTHTAGAAREEINPKTTARREARARIQRLAPAWIEASSRAIADQILHLPAWAAARTVALYLSHNREVQTGRLVEAARAAGKSLVVPAWNPTTGQYGWSALDRDAVVQAGPQGVMEPATPRWVPVSGIALFLVPLLAFDRYGRRLGHGGGHFDRLLCGVEGTVIGLAFEGQRLTAVPTDPHDRRLDLVITEARAYDARTDPA